MKPLFKFFRLPFPEKLLIIKTFTLLLSMRAGFLFFRYETLKKFLTSSPAKNLSVQKKSKLPKEKLVWAVEAVGNFFLFLDNCLIKAMVLEFLLRSQGYTAELCIGVQKGSEKKLEAHAWIESDGVIVMGGQPAFQAGQLR